MKVKLLLALRNLGLVALGFLLLAAVVAVIFGPQANAPFGSAFSAFVVGTWPYALGVGLLVVLVALLFGGGPLGHSNHVRKYGDDFKPGDQGFTGMSMSGDYMRHGVDSHNRPFGQ